MKCSADNFVHINSIFNLVIIGLLKLNVCSSIVLLAGLDAY